MNYKSNKILKVISLIFIIIMMVSCFGKTKKQIIKEFRETNVIIKRKDFEVSSSLDLITDEGFTQSIKLTNLRLKTKFNVSRFIDTYYSPEEYIYYEFIPLYVLKEYIYDKSIGNNFEEIENTINQYLIDSEKKFNLEKWNNPKIYVPSIGSTNKERNKVLDFYCYIKNDDKIEEFEDEECSDLEYVENESKNITYVREVINKYIPKKTRYDELNFSKFFEEYDKIPFVSIGLYNSNIETEEYLKEVSDFFETGGYLDKIRKNYNNNKMIVIIHINGDFVYSKHI